MRRAGTFGGRGTCKQRAERMQWHLGARLAVWQRRDFASLTLMPGRLSLTLTCTTTQCRLRTLSGASPWQVLSRQPSRATGTLATADTLAAVQHRTYAVPTVLLVRAISGEEEVPGGVVALLIDASGTSGAGGGSCPDVLSHSAVRARNSGVLMAGCYDGGVIAGLAALEGAAVEVAVLEEEVTVLAAGAGAGTEHAHGGSSSSALTAAEAVDVAAAVQPPAWCGAWVVEAAVFAAGKVGAKSVNTTALAGRLPAWVQQPRSAALPFGVFEQVLADESNAAPAARLGEVQRQLAHLVAQLEGTDTEEEGRHADTGAAVSDAAAAARATVMQLQLPKALHAQLTAALPALVPADAGGAAIAFEVEAVWHVVKEVYASQWNDRALLALRKVGWRHGALRMAVLLQPVIGLSYAFVSHTVSPVSGNADEVWVEVVAGQGEVLVGGWPGRALSAAVSKSSMAAALAAAAAGDATLQLPSPEVLASAVQVASFPSKPVALRMARSAPNGASGALMARSDSNAEDLPG